MLVHSLLTCFAHIQAARPYSPVQATNNQNAVGEIMSKYATAAMRLPSRITPPYTLIEPRSRAR